MQALSIIRNEHRSLGAVLFSLEKLVEEAGRGKQPDFKVLHGLLTYIDRFLDEYHHPREDQFLFPVLRKRCPGVASALDKLEQDHRTGEQMLGDVYKALSAYEFMGEPELEKFTGILKSYTDFERKHAMEEEKYILPLARERLETSDWERIDAAFADNDDPLFGRAVRGGFEDLYTAIVTMVPTPYGLGPEWK